MKLVAKNLESSDGGALGCVSVGALIAEPSRFRGDVAGNTMSVFVYDVMAVSDTPVVALIMERLYNTGRVNEVGGILVSIDEYRKLVGDYASADGLVAARLQYLEAFCRNIINPELKKYVFDHK